MILREWAALAGGDVRGDDSIEIERIGAVEDADERSLTFATERSFLREALASRAAAVLTEPRLADALVSPAKTLLVVASVRSALAALLARMQAPLARGPYRDPSAVVEPSARVGPDVYIGAHVYVGPGAQVGAACVLLARAIVGADARLGERCLLHPGAMLLDRCVAGDDVILHPNAVVGSDGFGFAPQAGTLLRIPQVGNVELGNGVEIGANACVDRAQTGSTRIGAGTKIDNLVQIGHNCKIGSNCAFAALTGLAGSTVVGDYVEVGGQTGFKGHITVGSRVKIAGQSAIWDDVPDGVTVSGHPARDHRDELRNRVRVRDLDTLYERVERLERKVQP